MSVQPLVFFLHTDAAFACLLRLGDVPLWLPFIAVQFTIPKHDYSLWRFSSLPIVVKIAEHPAPPPFCENIIATAAIAVVWVLLWH